MQPLQNTHFASALSAWIARERLTTGRAARWLGVSCRELNLWLAGTLPANDRLTSVLERIARGGR